MESLLMVTLPWPHSALNPNSRIHKAKQAGYTRSARGEAYAETLHALGLRRIDLPARVRLDLVFYPPADGRHRDLDNARAMCKAYQDGVFDAFEVNDSRIRCGWSEMAEPEGEGRVEIYIGEYKRLYA